MEFSVGTAVRQARLTLCIGLPGERGLGNTNGLSEACSFFRSLRTSQANRLNGKGCVSVFAGPVQIELVRTPTALFRPFNLARAAAVFQLRTTHRSPHTYLTRRPSVAKIGTVNQPFVIFLEAASQTATALLK